MTIKRVVVSVLLLIICYFAVSALFPWTRFNCEYEDIDIRTGRLRLTRYVLFCRISERIEESPLSEAIPAEMVAAEDPQWRRVNTFTPPGRHSPHHIFHSAIGQINMLARIWEMSETETHGLPANLKQKTARHVLALWQYGDDDSLVDGYLRCLHDLQEKRKRKKILAVLPTLEMPLVETNGKQCVQTVFFPNGQPMNRIHGYADPSGSFVSHGASEVWWSNGARAVYGRFEAGRPHGRRFQWDEDRKLIVIEVFNHGLLSEYETENLEEHPGYKVAQQLLARDGLQPRT